MAYISSASEYVLHCLLYLAGGEAGVREASVKDLAELQGVPAEYLAKLFTKLNKAGLVVATEGVKGGFSLSRPADRISVLDVVNAIEEGKPLFDCREIRSRCAIFGDEPPAMATQGVCAIHAVMLEAEARMRDVLASHSIGDLAQRALNKAPEGYGPAIVQWLGDRTGSRRVGRQASK